MKKSTFIMILSIFMAVLTAALPSLQIFAEDAHNTGEYISEVKIGVGKTADEAAKSLEGYVILQKDGKNADLNEGAGGGIGSKGERVVYLGYKTTNERSEAITDLAVMNMKGGYSVKDYELLMEQQMTEQIIPFVDGFLAAIEEYRENYNSEFPENKARAKYVHDMLNKLTDDDCGGKGLGDLLLNETKYEMGDAAYEALSESEKMNHADILTIIAQANGKATLIMENLLVRGADTNEDTWIDRFVNTTYDDLLGLYPDMLPSDAAAELAKEYDDDARTILSMWSALKEQLDNHENNVSVLDILIGGDLPDWESIYNRFETSTATEEDKAALVEAMAETFVKEDAFSCIFADITVRGYLSTIAFKDGSLLDFFLQDYETIANDITVLYPLAASLSAGQRAGLEFINLSDLIMISLTIADGYKSAEIDSLAEASIYENVDRGIYQKGGVALTSEALRAHSAEEAVPEDSALSTLSCILLGASVLSVTAFSVTAGIRIASFMKYYAQRKDNIEKFMDNVENIARMRVAKEQTGINYDPKPFKDANDKLNEELLGPGGLRQRYHERSMFYNKLMLGFGVAMVVLSGIALYVTYRDLVDYYNVDLSPIPRYIVDEKDITAFNEKGEKIVIKNQSAYYKAVECNRAEGDEWFDVLGASADLNGTVGRQWLALYAARNESESPILASSLVVVIGSSDVPAGHSTGIHMFGSDAAYNLNNTQFVWNNSAKSVYVYFGVEQQSGASTSGSSFSAGYFILAGVIGLLAGAAIAFGVTCVLKKKKNTAK